MTVGAWQSLLSSFLSLLEEGRYAEGTLLLLLKAADRATEVGSKVIHKVVVQSLVLFPGSSILFVLGLLIQLLL